MLSIIIPVYNAEKYLKRCIYSIVNQSYKNIEIIIVDDGSSDNSPAICDELAKIDSRIHVIHKKNCGAPAARNTGLKCANGAFITFVDADDWIDKKMYSEMISRAVSENSDIVICGSRWICEDGKLLKTECLKYTVFNNHEAMRRLLENDIKEQVWDKIYARTVVDGIYFVEGKKIDDIFWTYQVLGNANKVSTINQIYYNYFQNSESVMGVGYKSYWTDALDAMKLRCEYIKKNFPDLYDKALYVYIGSCHYHLQCAVRTNQPQEVIDNIQNRLSYRKTGHPTRGITAKQKFWYYLFTICPIATSKFRNRIGKGT